MRAGRKTRVRSFYDPTTLSPGARGYLRAPHTRPGPPGRAGALQCRPRSGQSDLVIVFFDSGGIIENACRQDISSSLLQDPTTHTPRVRVYVRAPHTRPGPSGRAGALQRLSRSCQSGLAIVFCDSCGINEKARMQDNSSSLVLRPHHAFSSRQTVPEGTPHPPRAA